MDTPDLPAARLIETLKGLRRVNAVTQSSRLMWPDLVAAAKRHPGETLRVLDVGAGTADFVVLGLPLAALFFREPLLHLGGAIHQGAQAVDSAGPRRQQIDASEIFSSRNPRRPPGAHPGPAFVPGGAGRLSLRKLIFESQYP